MYRSIVALGPQMRPHTASKQSNRNTAVLELPLSVGVYEYPSAHAPSANPPVPLTERTELAACSDIPIWELSR
jgi:hypothetical protein